MVLNSLRITEKEDISSCYFTIKETKLFWSRLSIFTGLQCFRVEAAFDQNPVVSRCFPSENRKSSGVKSYQVYWMQWTRIDSDGKVFSIRERLRKISPMLDKGVESRSDGVHRIHWTRIDSDGKVHFLFVRDLEKFRSCWIRAVESRSDGVHRIHWTRIDSDGKVHFLFVRDLEKFRLCWMRG